MQPPRTLPPDTPPSPEGDNKPSRRRPGPTGVPGSWIIGIIILGLVLLLAVTLPWSTGDRMPYSFFKQQLQAKNVKSVTIGHANLTVTLKKEAKPPEEASRKKEVQKFTVLRPNIEDRTLIEQLDSKENAVDSYDFEKDTTGWLVSLTYILPMLLLLVFIVLMMTRWRDPMGGGFLNSYVKSPAKRYEKGRTRVTFGDVAGMENAKSELVEVVDFLRSPEKYQKLGGVVPKGVLLVGPPGCGKCIVGDSLILTNKGMMEIQDVPRHYWVDPQTREVAGAHLPTVDLDTLQPRRQAASHWYDMGYQPTVRVTVRQGMTLEGTPEHPVAVWTEAGGLEFRHLAALQPGDLVALKFNTQAFGHSQDVDAEQAYLMGLLTGDGGLAISNRVELTSVNEELIAFFQEHMQRRYGRELNVARYPGRITSTVSCWKVKKELFRARMSSLLSYDKCIPPTILQAPKETVVAFLQGLFDTDAYVNHASVGYCTVSHKLMQQLTAMLLNLGIVPKVRIKAEAKGIHKHRVYDLQVTGTYLPVFAREVGFRLTRKQRQLDEYLSRAGIGVNTNVDVIGHVTPLVLAACQELRQKRASTSRLANLLDKVRDRGRITRNSLKALAAACKAAGCQGPEAQRLAALADADLFFSPVSKLEESMARVYDFTVPGTHSFLSNGFISHNTMLAKATAGEAGVPFFSMGGSEFIQMFVGVGASRVRDLFRTARENSPCILFIDEIDAVGRVRGAGLGGGHDEREQTLNQILSEMDGFLPTESVIVLAATNRPDVLDPALLRPGRFDRHITIDRPTWQGRLAILKVHTRDKPLSDDVNLERIAKAMIGMTGADLRNLANEAALIATRHNKTKIERSDFTAAADRILVGVKREEVLSADEKRRTAYHEAGHALVTWHMPDADKPFKVTIVPRGQALGVNLNVPEEDRYHHGLGYFRARLVTMMGGRAADRLVYNEFYSGAESDLKHATRIARAMVTHWGMSERLGPVAYRHGEEHVFLGKEISESRDFSEGTAQIIDEEVRRIVRDADEQAYQILQEHRAQLDLIVDALLQKEELLKDEIDHLLQTGRLDTPVETNLNGQASEAPASAPLEPAAAS